ncbi:MAG: PKD domain-containing protein, partial [Burkholderiales bacterium]|nr:PKD domain-containing protein [Burkholderiales bacterium]
MVLDANGDLQSVLPFASNIGTSIGGLVALELGPDGYLYYVEFTTGVVGRILSTAGTGGNLPPIAVATASPSAGYSPLSVSFSSAGSRDPEGFGLTYFWEFGDGATSTSPNPTHVYSASGIQVYTATLTVTDPAAATGSTTVPVTIGSLPPVVTIITPADLTTVSAGETVTYQGTAVDPDEGTLPPTAMQWTVLLHHNTHVHVVGEFTGIGGSFVIEDHDPVGTFLYEIILAATDSSGLRDAKSVVLPVFNPAALPEASFGFNEGSGTTAADATGNGHTGTLVNGPTWVPGKYDNGLSFDGVDDAVSVAGASSIELGAFDFTIMLWTKR